MVEALAWVVGGVVVLVALIAVSHRMLVTSREGGAGGGTDAFGAMTDIFDPARARADRDLESHNTMRQDSGTPDPDDADDPANTIIDGRSIRIRRPGP